MAGTHGELTDQLDVVRALWTYFDAREFNAVSGILSESFVAYWPQTGEFIHGRDNFIALNANYPGDWRCLIQRVFKVGDEVGSIVKIENGRDVVFAISLYQFEDSQLARAVEFFADRIDPPFDRSQWASRVSVGPSGLVPSTTAHGFFRGLG
jgi:hypothetical protein